MNTIVNEIEQLVENIEYQKASDLMQQVLSGNIPDEEKFTIYDLNSKILSVLPHEELWPLERQIEDKKTGSMEWNKQYLEDLKNGYENQMDYYSELLEKNLAPVEDVLLSRALFLPAFTYVYPINDDKRFLQYIEDCLVLLNTKHENIALSMLRYILKLNLRVFPGEQPLSVFEEYIRSSEKSYTEGKYDTVFENVYDFFVKFIDSPAIGFGRYHDFAVTVRRAINYVRSEKFDKLLKDLKSRKKDRYGNETYDIIRDMHNDALEIEKWDGKNNNPELLTKITAELSISFARLIYRFYSNTEKAIEALIKSDHHYEDILRIRDHKYFIEMAESEDDNKRKIELIKKALYIYPVESNFLKLYFRYSQEKKYEEILELCDAGLRIENTTYQVNFLSKKAYALSKLGRNDESIECLLKAIKYDEHYVKTGYHEKHDYIPYNNISYCYLQKDDPRAVDYFNLTVQYKPEKYDEIMSEEPVRAFLKKHKRKIYKPD